MTRHATWRQTFVLLLLPVWLAGQTVIELANNKYSIEDDVKLGQNAAEQVRDQLPPLGNDAIEGYVARLGARIVEAIPEPFEHPEFEYTFEVVDVDGINAFALPGGPMFLHRGMLEAALTEGGVVGVMAHEVSHVALRHGTAQATRGEKFQWGALAGTIFGAILGGTAGRAVAEGTRFGLGTFFLKYTREFEKQADLLGAQIMAKAGYAPGELGTMFELIQEQTGSGGPEWLSSHPNPGNRSEYIKAEAEALEIQDPVTDTSEFQWVRDVLNGNPPEGDPPRRAGGETPPPDPPDSQLRTYQVDDLFAIDVPSNWRELPGDDSVTYAPERGYVRSRQSSFSHGVQVGAMEAQGGDLEDAHVAFISSLTRGNPTLETRGQPQLSYFAGRRALVSSLTNLSNTTGRREIVSIRTTILSDDRFFYLIAVAPEDEFAIYADTLDLVAGSVRLIER